MSIETSGPLKELPAAMAKARTKFAAIVKNKTNTYYRSAYAELDKVVEATQPALSENGLSIIQFPVTHEGMAGVVSRLSHSSGEWMQATLLLPLSKNDAHGVGSAITYARRYAWQAICGVSAEDDDDANAAANKKKEEQVKQDMRDELAERFGAPRAKEGR